MPAHVKIYSPLTQALLLLHSVKLTLTNSSRDKVERSDLKPYR